MRDLLVKYERILGLILKQSSTNHCKNFNQFAAYGGPSWWQTLAMVGWYGLQSITTCCSSDSKRPLCCCHLLNNFILGWEMYCLKLPLPMWEWGILPPTLLGPIWVHTPKRHLDSLSHFLQSSCLWPTTTEIQTHTDHTTSVAMGCTCALHSYDAA